MATPYNPPRAPLPPATESLVTFPQDLLADSHRPYMTFQFFEWNRMSILTGGNFTPQSATIVLPMAKRLAEAQRSVWSQSDSTLLQIQAMATGGMSEGDVIKALGARAAPIIGVATDLGSAMTGAIANPWLTMLYRSPDLKRHSFTWNFTARNEKESKLILQILNTFRKHMLPKFGAPSVPGSAGFLSYPDILKIQYGPTNTKDYMHKFKPCVVETVDIDRSAAGIPSIFKSGAPVVIGMNINVVELEIWTQEDINDGDGGTDTFDDSFAGGT
jgi:hypothetical protein